MIARAVQILRGGGLVAFPTETVYGLGADASSESAVRRIFSAKGRPSTNPLIVHVADTLVARRYVRHWPVSAQKLVARYWPGPLTLVLPKTAQIPAIVTAGLDTVGLRVPDHPLALELLRAFDGPLAAPSANRSMRISPTTAEHVRRELGDKADLILDGGPCMVGIESAVLDLSSDPPTLLRPGGISQQEIESIVGPVWLCRDRVSQETAAASPGQHAIHYAPRAPAFRFEPDQWRPHSDPPAPEEIAVLVLPPTTAIASQLDNVRLIQMPGDARAYGRRLYAALREADEGGARAIYVEMPPDLPQWHAIRDRLIRATTPIVAPSSG